MCPVRTAGFQIKALFLDAGQGAKLHVFPVPPIAFRTQVAHEFQQVAIFTEERFAMVREWHRYQASACNPTRDTTKDKTVSQPFSRRRAGQDARFVIVCERQSLQPGSPMKHRCSRVPGYEVIPAAVCQRIYDLNLQCSLSPASKRIRSAQPWRMGSPSGQPFLLRAFSYAASKFGTEYSHASSFSTRRRPNSPILFLSLGLSSSQTILAAKSAT